MSGKRKNNGKKPGKSKLSIHIINNWPTYLISFILLMLAFYITIPIIINDLKNDIKNIIEKIETQGDEIEKLSDKASNTNEQIIILEGRIKMLEWINEHLLNIDLKTNPLILKK